ncbi:MAG: hypothetical protein M5U22_09560 [Thermoleophilia bacterium]|nr:hypothetical protein [Thermoleophilia bacterium]
MAAVDWYHALERLQQEGIVESFCVVPYLARLNSSLTVDEIADEVVAGAHEVRADIVLWAHTQGLHSAANCAARLRSVGVAAIGYWDGDWYHPYRNPFPGECLALCSVSDVAFVQGDGLLVGLLHRAGCEDVRYVPASTDDRFVAQPARSEYDWDLVMIGNRISSRLPFKDMPGAILRRKLVRMFERRLGNRFAVFGHGWTGASAQGPVDYEKQAEAYGLGIASLGCNNWFTRYYFSDRLPIAMASARPSIYYQGEGYDEVFGSDAGVFWYRDLDTAWKQFLAVSADPDAALERAERARNIAVSGFTTYRTLIYMLDVLAAHADAETQGVAVRPVPNPWISRSTL